MVDTCVERGSSLVQGLGGIVEFVSQDVHAPGEKNMELKSS